MEYPCSHYLLTPLLNPNTNAELQYYRAHVTTRNGIERTFGVMKNKFRCFFNGMNMNIETTKSAIVAIAIMHNIMIDNEFDIADDEIEEEGNAEHVYINDNVQNGNIFKQNYIRRHFN
ncbi:DDE superfamily endonuclease [Popillia japonica]|uniref:DDE superfamily endonuclease n=1 Tax=Popillia japonica TaxID=7064 RepID=A0AAW1LQS7_POPJA